MFKNIVADKCQIQRTAANRIYIYRYKGGDVNVVQKVHVEYANKIIRDI